MPELTQCSRTKSILHRFRFTSRIQVMFLYVTIRLLQDVAARVRFQKYRGLKSFRTSVWDKKENLPADYARIFQFENFDRTKKRVLEEKVEGAEVNVI